MADYQHKDKPPLRDASRLRTKRDRNATNYNGTPRDNLRYPFQSNYSNGDPVLITRTGRLVDKSSLHYRLYAAEYRALVEQRGGMDSVTPAELILISDAAWKAMELRFDQAEAAMTNGKVDRVTYLPLGNSLSRTLKALGIKKKRRRLNPLIEGEFKIIDSD